MRREVTGISLEIDFKQFFKYYKVINSKALAEAWAKRRYEKAFVSKLTDSLGEEYETENWLDYSKDCKYIKEETRVRFLSEYDEVRKMLISIINNPEKWCL